MFAAAACASAEKRRGLSYRAVASAHAALEMACRRGGWGMGGSSGGDGRGRGEGRGGENGDGSGSGRLGGGEDGGGGEGACPSRPRGGDRRGIRASPKHRYSSPPVCPAVANARSVMASSAGLRAAARPSTSSSAQRAARSGGGPALGASPPCARPPCAEAGGTAPHQAGCDALAKAQLKVARPNDESMTDQ